MFHDCSIPPDLLLYLITFVNLLPDHPLLTTGETSSSLTSNGRPIKGDRYWYAYSLSPERSSVGLWHRSAQLLNFVIIYGYGKITFYTVKVSGQKVMERPDDLWVRKEGRQSTWPKTFKYRRNDSPVHLPESVPPWKNGVLNCTSVTRSCDLRKFLGLSVVLSKWSIEGKLHLEW